MSEDNTPKELNTQLATLRTSLAFRRTDKGGDRTMMAVVRTSLSLISFGFTIFHFFEHLKGHIFSQNHHVGPRIFGFSLVTLGIGTLILGIIYHLKFSLDLRKEREDLTLKKMLPAIDKYPVSMSLIVALLLLIVGLIMIATMILDVRSTTNAS